MIDVNPDPSCQQKLLLTSSIKFEISPLESFSSIVFSIYRMIETQPSTLTVANIWIGFWLGKHFFYILKCGKIFENIKVQQQLRLWILVFILY